MWCNIPKTKLAVKKTCLKHLRVIVDKKVFLDPRIIVSQVENCVNSTIIEAVTGKIIEPDTRVLYSVWRGRDTPFWFVDGCFLPVVDALQQSSEYQKISMHKKGIKKRVEKIRRLMKWFAGRAQRRRFIIVTYTVGNTVCILDGNHRLAALSALGIVDWPVKVLNIGTKAGHGSFSDRLCPDIYILNRQHGG